jgi:leucyl/phenylalanyl-tRNA---protein transferase
MSHAPVEPPPTPWQFPSPPVPDERGLVCVGGDLEPGTLLAAYRAGLFPMPMPASRWRRHNEPAIGWFSPDPRAVLPLDSLAVSRSLPRSLRRFDVTVDTSFEAVMRACGDPRRPHGWINEDFVDAYTNLHRLGWAHSVETWHDGDLVGGLYGVAIGGLFAGESMFHRVADASKVALVSLVERLRERGYHVLDVQWRSEHLASLGVVELSQHQYLDRLTDAVRAAVRW